MRRVVLSAVDVGFSFASDGPRDQILQNIDLELVRGRAVALVGKSGTGKTTLCKLLAGLLRPTQGEIHMPPYDGISGPSAVVLASQEQTCFPWLTARQNVMFGLLDKGRGQDRHVLDQAGELLDRVGLQAYADAYPATLSGGMLQRVSIARALAVRPAILILDEPFSALDVVTKTNLVSLLKDLQCEFSFALLAVLHSLDDALGLAEETIVLSGKPASIVGRLQMVGRSYSAFSREVLELLDE